MPEEIRSDEFIIRRIPPSKPQIQLDFIKPIDDRRYRATSIALALRQGETGLSCSRLRITSPKQLLAQDGVTITDGWTVAIWRVDELPTGLQVVATPSKPAELDLGHCEIRPIDRYTKALQSKLAGASVILSAEEIDSMNAGEIPHRWERRPAR